MRIAELVLDFVAVLAWPLVVLVAVLILSPELKSLIKRTRSATWGSAELAFDDDARAIEIASQEVKAESAQKAASSSFTPSSRSEHDARQESSPGSGQSADRSTRRPSATTILSRDQARSLIEAVEDLRNGPDFAISRELNSVSPEAAVLLAFRELERTARIALTVRDVGTAPRLASASLLLEAIPDDEFGAAVVRDLVKLRNQVAHASGEGLSRGGAEDYIHACENLSAAIRTLAASRARHPSRSHLPAVVSDVLGKRVEPEDLLP